MKDNFEDWLKTDIGMSCNDIYTLSEQPYLKNRLKWAFDAGANSTEKFKHMSSCINSLHSDIRKLKNERNKLLREFKKINKA